MGFIPHEDTVGEPSERVFCILTDHASRDTAPLGEDEALDTDVSSSDETVLDAVDLNEKELGSEDISYEAVVESDERDAQIADLQGQLLRTRADFDNFRRRTRQEKEELSQFATKKLIADLLPTIDNFERALSALDTVGDDQVKTGIEMVHRQLVQVLDGYGVTPMEVLGQPFDPARHEAVMQEPAENETLGTVLQELQKGYLLHDKVLRPAMVKVSV